MKTHKLSDKISGKYFEIIESLKSESCLLFHSFVEFNFIVGVTARVVWDIFEKKRNKIIWKDFGIP